jgi:hypothetical protein
MAVAAKPEISKILLDLGIEPVDVYAVDNAEKTYMSAVREGINTIESATKGKGDPRSEILREEFTRLRENKKKRVRASKLFTKTSIVPVNKIKPQSLLPPAEEPFSSGSQKKDGTRNILEDILRILKLGFKSDKKESEFDRKERQKQKREKKEKAIESVKGGLKSAAKVGAAAASKILSPFQQIWQTISNFIKTVIIGTLINGALNWFGKKENQEKMGRVIRFLKFWWPSILTGYLAFFTPIGALVTGAVSFLTWALPALAGVINANPILAGAAGLSALMLGAKALDGDFDPNKELTEEEKIRNEENLINIMEMEGITLNKGGVIPGSGNKDTVPAMLTPGEFVMTQGAVKQYGTNIFEGMNAAASSGSVVQNFKEGGVVQNFNQGGVVQNFNQGGVVENPTEKQKLALQIKNQMAGSQESKTEIKNIVLPSKKSNVVPVTVPIKVRSISKTTVLPAIEKQKTSQPTRPGTTVPVFNINSASAARSVTLISLGIEETL